MCDCLSRLPRNLKSTVSHVLESRPDLPIYVACAIIEPNVSRQVYHCILRWAESLVTCPECGPRLDRRNTDWIWVGPDAG